MSRDGIGGCRGAKVEQRLQSGSNLIPDGQIKRQKASLCLGQASSNDLIGPCAKPVRITHPKW
jgi:hypothetical protein